MKSLLDALEYKKRDMHLYVLLISAPLLLTLYWYYGNARFLLKIVPAFQNNAAGDIYAHIMQFASFFLLTFLLPLVYIKFIRRESPAEYGLQMGDKRYGFLFVLIAVPLIVAPLIYIAAGMPDIRAEYPLSKALYQHREWVLWYELAYVVFYYIAWEFFFRGFLLFGIKKYWGAMPAVLIQTISSCLIHLGKPDGEILGSIVIGILFGAIALRTRSIWYVFILHAAIGVLTDVFVMLR
ncbi:MAG TPA: CPBP family intramembrane metalloprotease [Caldithrix abyssi]|uniref:CPBP family intramembrane metalloprotease n=1 Tax=Caldithrix abyssi TaxID=187145 RepID=A0A7V4TY91_CALAY|nr:CPBP family intramembrane metalloprotease [Caldithrix abyssi]